MSTETQAVRRVIGRPFQPGQSGNPRGRPRGRRRQMKARLRELGHEYPMAFFWLGICAMADDIEGEVETIPDEKTREDVRQLLHEFGLVSQRRRPHVPGTTLAGAR